MYVVCIYIYVSLYICTLCMLMSYKCMWVCMHVLGYVMDLNVVHLLDTCMYIYIREFIHMYMYIC